MASTEHAEQVPLPLNEAASRLGVTADALRMRLRRGKARGYKRGGRVFVYVDAALSAAPGGQEGPEAEQANMRPRGANAARGEGKRSNTPGHGNSPQDVIIEFQRIELKRLLKENERLNERLDKTREATHELAEMLRREQILRQQEYGLRQQLQDLIARLSGPLALASPNNREAIAAGTQNEGRAHATPPDMATAAPGPPFGSRESTKHDDSEEGDSEETDRSAASRSPGVIVRAAAHPGFPPPPPASSGPQRPEAMQDLAEIVRDIGQSLREIEETAHSEEPARGIRGQRGEISQDDSSEQDDPSEEERRNAARLMKRLMRGRPARHLQARDDDPAGPAESRTPPKRPS